MSSSTNQGTWSKYAQDLEEHLTRLYQVPTSGSSGDTVNYDACAHEIDVLMRELHIQLEWAKAKAQAKEAAERTRDPDERIRQEMGELRRSKEKAARIIQQQMDLLKRWQERFTSTSTQGMELMKPPSSTSTISPSYHSRKGMDEEDTIMGTPTAHSSMI